MMKVANKPISLLLLPTRRHDDAAAAFLRLFFLLILLLSVSSSSGGNEEQQQKPRRLQGSCNPNVMWTLTYRDNSQWLSRVNVRTGQSFHRGTFKEDQFADALAVDPTTNKLYTVVDANDNSIRFGIRVLHINRRTGATRSIATIPDVTRSFSIASNSRGMLYFSTLESQFDPSKSGLWTIDPRRPASAKKIGNIRGEVMLFDLAFDSNDNLYAVDQYERLLEVHYANSSWPVRFTELGKLKNPFSADVPNYMRMRIDSIAFDRRDRLYALAGNDDNSFLPRGMTHAPVYEIVQTKAGKKRLSSSPRTDTRLDWPLGAAFGC